MKSLVSVVVPVRNREDQITRCLDSVAAQTYRPLELIVVDNDSDDDTFDTANNWKGSIKDPELDVKVVSETVRGACAARQKGLDNVSGEYVIFFDSDDVMRPALIETAISVVSKSPEADVVCWPCSIRQLDGSIKIPTFMPENPVEGHLIHTLFRPQGTLLKTNYIKNIGGWGKPISVWNDFELGLRIILGRGKITGINKVLADIYAQPDSITGENFSSKQGLWEKTIEEMRHENSISDYPLKKEIDDILTYREIILASHYALERNFHGAGELSEKAMKRAKNKLQKLLLQFTYLYTRLGGRGAWRLIRKLFLSSSH